MMKPPFLRTAYNYDMNKAGDESALECKDPTKTQQHMADETDINVIVRRYTATGELPNRSQPPMSGDFTDAGGMQEAMDLVVRARMAFMEQPAEIRARFNNDPVQFVEFCSDERNRDDMRRMGMWSEEATRAFELEAQTAEDLKKANQRAADELKALKRGKGDTEGKGVT